MDIPDTDDETYTLIDGAIILDNEGTGLVSGAGSTGSDFINTTSLQNGNNAKKDSAGYDLEEQNSDCSANTWEGSVYDTASFNCN